MADDFMTKLCDALGIDWRNYGVEEISIIAKSDEIVRAVVTMELPGKAAEIILAEARAGGVTHTTSNDIQAQLAKVAETIRVGTLTAAEVFGVKSLGTIPAGSKAAQELEAMRSDTPYTVAK